MIEEKTINITVEVRKKTFTISAGDGSQKIKWLGHVAIARWDEENNQGWKYLGIPVSIKNTFGMELDPIALIKDNLHDGDKIFVTTSLDPSETL